MQARRRFAGSESDDTTSLTAIVVSDDLEDITKDSDTDKKYEKRWNFRNLSNHISTTFTGSGNALKSFIQPITDNNNVTKIFTTPTKYIIGTGGGGGGSQQSNERDLLLSSTTSQNNNDNEQDSNYEDLFVKEDIIVMTSRDRTTEFANAIRSLQSRNISRAVNVRDPRKAKQIQSYSEFMNIAKYIGKNIASTYAKLEKLTLLAKRKSLFDDRPAEIQELTYIIKGDLNALNQQIARLQELSKDQRKSTINGKHLLSHSSNMVLALQAKLANMSTDFKQILEVRTENLKHQKTRRDQFSQGPIAGGAPPSTSKHGSLLLSEENQVSIEIGGAGNDMNQQLIPVNGQQQNPRQIQTQQMLMYDESDNYLQQRAETMQNIESTIVELGGIFQQLAHMVQEQEEIVERIDTNVQDAEMNIEAAHGEILKYFQSVTKNRWLMIKIFGVLIFFFIFFVIFLA